MEQVFASDQATWASKVLEAPESAKDSFNEAAEAPAECAKSQVSEYGVEVRSSENVFSVVFLVDSFSSELVVLFSLLVVGQYRVGFGDFLELLSGVWGLVPVRVIL